MKYLFVGGPRNGQRLEIPDGREQVQFLGSMAISGGWEERWMEIETYRLQRWCYACGGKEPQDVECFAYVHESVVNPVEELIAGYRPGVAISAKLDYFSTIDMRAAVLGAAPSDAADALEKVHRWHREAEGDGRVLILLPSVEWPKKPRQAALPVEVVGA